MIADPETWVDAYGDYLFRYAMLRLRDEHAARDAVQETFLAGIRNVAKFDGALDIKYWLRGILKFKIVDHIRRAAREQPVEVEDDEHVLDRLLFKTSGIPTMNPAPWAFDPHSAFDREDFWAIFESCLDGLKEPMRRAFVLKMVDELDTNEVCEALGLSANHVWVLNHRARSLMKQCLEKKWVKAR